MIYDIKAELNKEEVVFKSIYTQKRLREGGYFIYQKERYKIIEFKKVANPDEDKLFIGPKWKQAEAIADGILLSLLPKEEIWEQTLKEGIDDNKLIYG